MEKKLIIAIDGRSSCGKSSFAIEIARKLDYLYLDSGAMYRAVALFCIRKGFASGERVERESVIRSLPEIDIHFSYNHSEEHYETFLNSENVEWDIRTVEVTRAVSSVSAIPEVRDRMVELQRKIGFFKGIVIDGRDIGTVVFPDADIKIFMTATEDIRAGRRHKELMEKGIKTDIEEVKRGIRKRDKADETREASPLKMADDAILLDNSNMTIEEQMEWFMEIYRRVVSGM